MRESPALQSCRDRAWKTTLKVDGTAWKLPVSRLVTMSCRPSEWPRVVRWCADTSVWSQSSISPIAARPSIVLPSSRTTALSAKHWRQCLRLGLGSPHRDKWRSDWKIGRHTCFSSLSGSGVTRKFKPRLSRSPSGDEWNYFKSAFAITPRVRISSGKGRRAGRERSSDERSNPRPRSSIARISWRGRKSADALSET